MTSFSRPRKTDVIDDLVNNKAFIIDGFGFGEMGRATALKFGLSKYFLLMNGVEAISVETETNKGYH